MKRTLVWLVGGLILAEGIALAVPARLSYEPEAEPKRPAFTVLGTRWVGKDLPEGVTITIIFDSKNTFTYIYDQGGRLTGTWKLEGNIVYFELNSKYREFRGTVRQDLLQGDSWNITGARWQTHLQRVYDPR